MPAVKYDVMTVTINGRSFIAPARWMLCRGCGKRYLAKLRELKRGRGRSCSVKCALATRQLKDQRGEKNFASKLTWKQVQEIRAERRQGAALWILAADYGVSAQTVWDIVRFRSWKSAPLPEIAPELKPKRSYHRHTPQPCGACAAGDCLRCDGGGMRLRPVRRPRPHDHSRGRDGDPQADGRCADVCKGGPRMRIAMGGVDDRAVVRCDACSLVQFAGDAVLCRRCHAPFKAPDAVVVEVPAVPVFEFVCFREYGSAFATGLRLARTGQGMSQRDLARKTGLLRTYISKIETQGITPYPTQVERLAHGVGLSTMAFVELIDAVFEYGEVLQEAHA